MSVQQWLYEIRQWIRDVFSAEYMLSKGGRNAMFQDDLDTLSETVLEQFEYLQNLRGSGAFRVLYRRHR